MADTDTTHTRVDSLDRFSPPTRSWFMSAFPEGPTPAQAEAWEAIARTRDVLVVAPTGSGKTLAAFLWAIDRLVAEERPVGPRGPRILYISPMKALGVDISRNLRTPLSGIAACRREASLSPVDIHVGVRSGDTPSSERSRLLRHPPDILITTPESLYLMETSRAQEVLCDVDTVIVDEVHAVAGSKRGAHLALSLERLDLLTRRPAQRIGLSATVRPRDEVARFLGGARPVDVVAPDAPVDLDIRVVAPVTDMTDLSVRGAKGLSSASTAPGVSGGGDEDGRTSIWPHVEAAILDQVMAHRSTIVFVNSRGLAEKLTARLNELHAERASHSARPGDRVPGRPPLTLESRMGGTSAHLTGPPESGPSRERETAEGASSSRGAPPGPGMPVPDVARAHHGSVSRERRELIEHDLKSGDLRCVVATSSLELGIDMGAVDLVIQVAAPPSVASGLQRAGRAGHRVGAASRAVVYPRTRRELIDSAVTVERMGAGLIEELHIPRSPLDVLAQQTVAATVAASDPGVLTPDASQDAPGLKVDAWFAAVRRAAPYRDLSRVAFDGVLDMLSGRYPSEAFSELRPRLVWDRAAGVLRSRPGTRRLAVTNGGTIPDRGSYRVVLPEEEGARGARRVGELDEEMVFESRVGDVITLGAATWRIQEITMDRVVVVPAPGRPARLPFWHGDGPGRPAELGRAIGSFVRAMGGVPTGSVGPSTGGDTLPVDEDVPGRSVGAATVNPVERRLQAAGLDDSARRNLRTLLDEQRAATGVVPDDRTLVLERNRDEAGDWRLVLHSCYGRAVNAAWALAVAERLREQLGTDAQVMAADDGIVALVPDTAGRLPGAEAFRFDPVQIRALVRDGVGQSALFAGHFRECASRALLLPRRDPARRTPLWQQRQRASQLLSVASAYPDFPILLETARECLQDVYDLPALSALMESLESGDVEIVEAQTVVPSPFAQSLLFGYVADHVYDTDTPVAERRASLLSLDTALLADLLGEVDLAELLDPEVVVRVARELQRLTPDRHVRGSEGVADLLRLLGPLSEPEIGERLRVADEASSTDEGAGVEAARACVRELAARGRVVPVQIAGLRRWAAVEDVATLRDGLGIAVQTDVPEIFLGLGTADPLGDLVRRHARTHGLFTTADLAQRLGIGVAVADQTLERLRAQATVVRVDSRSGAGAGSHWWVDAGVLRVLRLRSLAAARAATRPVDAAAYVRFLLDWQGVRPVVEPGSDATVCRPAGGFSARDTEDPMGALERALDQLAGVALPASVWESAVLPVRVPNYRPSMLDQLIATGALVWCGAGRLGTDDGLVVFCPADVAEELLPGPTDASHTGIPQSPAIAHGLATRVLDVLSDGGAYFADQIAGLVMRRFAGRRARGEIEVLPPDRAAGQAGTPSSMEIGEVLRDLMWAGQVTSDSFEPARSAVGRGRPVRASRSARRPVWGRVRTRTTTAHEGRWALVSRGRSTPTARALAAAEAFVDRYGVVSRGSVMAEGTPGGFGAVLPVMRVLEDSGRVARGHFVSGLGGAQFARADAVDRLRACERGTDGRNILEGIVAVSAVDPANPFGAALAWPPSGGGDAAGAPARRVGAFVVISDGQAVVWMGRGGRSVLTFTSDRETLGRAAQALADTLIRGGLAPLTVETVDGTPVHSTSVAPALRDAGFVETPRGLRLYP